jgi:hypothetical protein
MLGGARLVVRMPIVYQNPADIRENPGAIQVADNGGIEYTSEGVDRRSGNYETNIRAGVNHCLEEATQRGLQM